jgi:RND family efflux transporter MFP subunit
MAPHVGLKLGIAALLIAAVLAGAFIVVHVRRLARESELANATAASASAPPTVYVVEAQAGPAMQTLKLPGETRGWFESTIYARVNGFVKDWKSDIGDRVHAGQVLAAIDTPDLDAQLAASNAKLKVSLSQVKVGEAAVQLAKTTYDRWWDAPKDIVSQQEREEKKDEYDSSIAQLNAARSQVNLDQADVDRLTALEGFKKVTAPFDGVIMTRHIDIGDLVTAGSTNSTTSLYTVSKDDPIRIFVDVPQAASGGMKVGVPAVAVSNEFLGRQFRGTIARTSNSIDPAARTLHVEVDVPNSDMLLLPGMYLEVSFQIHEPTLVQVPASAIVFRSSGPQVAVVSDDGTVNFQKVNIAQDDGEVLELDSGIKNGDRVALNISSQITDGDHVNAENESGRQQTAMAEH